ESQAVGAGPRPAAGRDLQRVQPGEPRASGPLRYSGQHGIRVDHGDEVPDRRFRIRSTGAVRGEVPLLSSLTLWSGGSRGARPPQLESAATLTRPPARQ